MKEIRPDRNINKCWQAYRNCERLLAKKRTAKSLRRCKMWENASYRLFSKIVEAI